MLGTPILTWLIGFLNVEFIYSFTAKSGKLKKTGEESIPEASWIISEFKKKSLVVLALLISKYSANSGAGCYEF